MKSLLWVAGDIPGCIVTAPARATAHLSAGPERLSSWAIPVVDGTLSDDKETGFRRSAFGEGVSGSGVGLTARLARLPGAEPPQPPNTYLTVNWSDQ